jgi:HEAT repeat protein
MGILKNIATTRPETEKFLVETALHSADEGLREMAAEALFEGHPGVVDAILDEIDGLSEDVQLLAFDVLYRYPGSDRTLAKLVAHFRTGENIPLFAEYIASFGDERAIPELIAYAKSASMTKFEFREIRNAVEALGGDMPDYNYEIVG